MRAIVTLIIIGDLMMDEGPLEGGDVIMIEVEGHQIEGTTRREVIQEEEDPLMTEDPLMMEDPLEMEDIQDDLEDEDHQVHQDLLDHTTYHSPATPGSFGHNSFGKYFWDSWPVNAAIG